MIAPDSAPQSQENLGDYLRRLRLSQGLSQQELAQKADLHLQSIGKIERNQTQRLTQKGRERLALALGIPPEYFDTITQGTRAPLPLPLPPKTSLKLCLHCWQPGDPPHSLWMDDRALYCALCGQPLRDHCRHCGEAILSHKHRFCPYCGQGYGAAPSSP